jgi:hypothetical protein
LSFQEKRDIILKYRTELEFLREPKMINLFSREFNVAGIKLVKFTRMLLKNNALELVGAKYKTTQFALQILDSISE